MILLLQVAAVLSLVNGQGTTTVRNPSREPLAVTVALVHDTATQDHIGRPVRALVAPRAFTLQPGEVQVVRLQLREAVPPLIRLVTTFRVVDTTTTPTDRPVARLVLETRLVSKVLTQ
jgi:hypothetical protein